ncbi:NUDIX domain-containing protein [Candidatus Parcubacteria bacterium]|nr:MAG: NUDIX domain-containing protein [Candidatus Parcubacteria bacterium]
MKQYDHTKIEKKWQKAWADAEQYKTPDQVKGKDNFYLLVEFPYPSGNLHVGHWYAFAVPDMLARLHRMNGKNVMYPIGFDAFGLPAENAAIKNKLNPRTWTEQNIAHMKNQIASMGTSFDLSRMVSTIDPAYYKWTQWQFLQFFKKGLAYQKDTPVNWCPNDKTVLANEQVVTRSTSSGQVATCERCGHEVVQKQMLQWNIKITDYADRLVDDLDPLDWPNEIKESQRNWIGRSEGAEIDFPLEIGDNKKYKYVILHGFQSSPDRPRWLWLKSELEKSGHEVVMPSLPNPDDPSEQEWVETAINATTYDENTVLVGHSLGAVTALKVVERLKKPIFRLVTVGGFANREFKDKKRPFEETWKWEFDGEKIRSKTKAITVLHDPKDHAISDAQAKKLADLLGVAVTTGTSTKSHFAGDKEPDVLMWLRPTIRVFTTRPDTLFGATYLVLAPEHPWVALALQHKTVLKNNDEVQKYVDKANKKTDLERQESKEKTGVKLEGIEAINPASGEKIPLFVADYVLSHYGTGAIMAVPAHDERDFEFAQKFDLPIPQVVAPVIHVTKGGDAVREGEPMKKRDAVMAIVKHWEKDEYLCIEWKEFDEIRTFISGGIEEGEDVVEAGKREIAEESGYKNAKFIRSVGQVQFVEFYHQAKKGNVRAKMHYLYFELENGEQEPLSAEEDAKHSIVWKKRDEVRSFLTINEIGLIWDQLEHGNRPYVGAGELINSGEFDGLSIEGAKKKMTAAFGREKKTYRLRDWIVSRQRYWGVPIPIVHCDNCGPVAVPDDQLPVRLPDVEDYLPSGEGKSPLAKVDSFVHTTCPKCGGEAKRETDTLDTFVDSSWYFLRYTDPHNSEQFAENSKQKNWMPIDLYSGGAEHTTMHVLYSRFWHKALFDLGLVADAEPYTRRMNRSIILGPDGQKMSKSRGNVIDPDAVVAQLGADTVRMYLAFIGPYNEVGSYPWNPDGVVGVRRFLERLWKAQQYVQKEEVASLQNVLHKTIKKVGEDATQMKFNTAIAQLMVFLNALEKEKKIGESQWKTLLMLVAPFAPHIAEELWSELGDQTSVHAQSWPEFDPKLMVDDEKEVAIQIDGKTRGTIVLPTAVSKDEIEKQARLKIEVRLKGVKVARVIVVPGRLINFVTTR